jgi:diguanylate cyclase (GGDEF)-like protein
LVRRKPADGEKVSCTISVGVAARRADDTTAEDCLKRADRAMYRAKAHGRNRVEVDSGSDLRFG